MNLIEKLGGYEEAKRQGEKWGFDDHLNNALLEYRRENNIFEVGDKIIVVQMAIENRSVYEILKIDGDILMIEDEYLYIEEIRHATPEEIKAGHRL